MYVPVLLSAVEQLSDKINSVTCASIWNYILEYFSDTWDFAAEIRLVTSWLVR